MKNDRSGIESVFDIGTSNGNENEGKNPYLESAHLLRDYLYKRSDAGFDLLKNTERMYENLFAIGRRLKVSEGQDDTEKLLARYGGAGRLGGDFKDKRDVGVCAMEIACGLYETLSKYADKIKGGLTETDQRIIFRIITSSPREFPDLYSKISNDVDRVGRCIRDAGAVDTLILVEKLGRGGLLWRYNNTNEI